MIEVVSGISEKKLLGRSNLFSEENIISLDLLLNVGNISKIESIKTRKIFNKTIYIKNSIDQLVLKTKNKEDIRIWYSSVNSEDTCFMYFVVYLINKYFEDKTIFIIDVSKLNMPSLGSFCEKEINSLIDLKVELSNQNKKLIADNWKKLVEINSDLRLIENNKLNSYSYEYIDEKILKALSKYREIDTYSLVGIEFMPRGLCSIYGDLIFHYRIDSMIKNGRIKLIRKEINKNSFGVLSERNIISILE